MKVVFALFLALPLSAATISLSPSTPKAGDSVVVTIHDMGSFCPAVTATTTAKLSGKTLQVDVVVPPGACQLACPAIPAPVTYTAPAVTLPDAQPYTIEYAFTDCNGTRHVVATKPILVTPSCAFDRSLTVTRTTSGALNFTWCDPTYSPFPDFGQSATAYRIYVVGENEAPILVQELSTLDVGTGTSATVALTNREAGARSAFAEASLCEITVAGCRGESVIRSNVVPLDVAPVDNCSFGGAALCLANRFSVTARFHTDGGGSNPAHPVPITGDSGYFWFFGPNNAEIVVKIVDACSLSSNFWFFAAGMTDVGVDLVVTDTKTHAVRRYSNPAGSAFVPIQDTNAFAGCQ